MAYAQDMVSRYDEDYEDLGVGTLYYNHGLDSLDQAAFPGGEKAMYDFVMDQFRWPPRSFEADFAGTVLVQFIVEPDGSLSHVWIKRDLGFGTGDEVKRVVSNMPKWSPARYHGAAVRSLCILPVKLVLNKEWSYSDTIAFGLQSVERDFYDSILDDVFLYSDDSTSLTLAVGEWDDKRIIFKLDVKTNNRKSPLYDNGEITYRGIAELKEGDLESDEDENGISNFVDEYVYQGLIYLAIRFKVDDHSLVTLVSNNPLIDFRPVLTKK